MFKVPFLISKQSKTSLVSLQRNVCEYLVGPVIASHRNAFAFALHSTPDFIQVLRIEGVTFTGDMSIMTKLMSMSSWVLERSSEEDLQLQTKETSEGFRVATRGLLTMPGRDGAETCRAVYCMEFEMQAN